MNREPAPAQGQRDSAGIIRQLTAQCGLILRDNERYRAFIRTYFPSAPNELDALLRAYCECNRKKPLFGLSYAVKDNIAVAGSAVSFGLSPALIERASESAGVVECMNAGGAFLIGSTNLDEGCLSAHGVNRHFGRVINPRAHDRSALGSSAGSAAAVALGQADVAFGTDFGGSVRAPAVACGVAGLKLSPGMISLHGVINFSTRMDGIGIIAQDVEDFEPLFDAPGMFGSLNQEPQIGLNFIVPSSRELDNCDESCRAQFENALEALSLHGGISVSQKHINLDESLRIRKVLAAAALRDTIAQIGIDPERLPANVKATLAFAGKLSASEIDAAAMSCKKLSTELDRDVFLLTPALPNRPFLWKEYEKGAHEGKLPVNYFLALANICGLPALSFCRPGVKECTAGFQLAGSPGADRELVRAGIRLREIMGGGR